MATTLAIGGVDKTGMFEFPSLSISDNLNHRNDCSFVLSDQTGVYRPSVGQEVIITKDGTRIFAGSIDEWEEEDLPGQVVEGIIPCVDYNQIADRHLVARVYENQTLGAIVADMVTQDLAGEGITTTNVQSGPIIAKAAFNYRTVAEAFNELSQLTGYDWYIDYYKDLHFFSRETNTAPFSITDASYNYRNMKVRYTREQYRNRQYIRAGHDITDARTEEFKGDGKTKTFPLSFPVAKVPSAITVNGASKSVGIKGVDTGKDWYWNKGEREIVQDDAAAALISTDTLAVTYQGLYPIIISSQDDTEIAARASTEGGTGLYEDVEEDTNIDSRDLATSKAEALLRRFGRIPRIITFETDTGGLRAGQLISITNARRNLSGNFLIESVTARADQLDLVYTVKALDGEALGGWVEFFQKLAQSTRKFVIRENEVLGLLRRFSEAIVLTDALSTATAAPLQLAVQALPTFTRASAAYTIAGVLVSANQPRYEPGKFGKGVLLETAAINLATNPFLGGTYVGGLASNWLNNNGATVSENLDPQFIKYGIKSQHVIASAAAKGIYQLIAHTNNTAYHRQVWVYIVSGQVQLWVDNIDHDGVNAPRVSPLGITGWFLLGHQTLVADGTAANLRIVSVGAAEFYVDSVMVEQKAYATSFMDGTRNNELLNVTTPGTLSLAATTIGMWVNVNDAVKRYNVGASSDSRMVNISKASGLRAIFMGHKYDSAHFRARFFNDAGSVTDFTVSSASYANGWHHFALAWELATTKAKFLIDGIRIGESTGATLPAGLYPLWQIGSHGADAAATLCSVISDVFVKNTYMTDADILAVVNSGAPAPVDANTTLKLEFEDSLIFSPQLGVGSEVLA